MMIMANGHLVGWLGITEEDLQQQISRATLHEIPLGRAPDLRRPEPYGRLIPLYRVCPGGGNPAKERVRWLCRCTCERGTLVVVLASNLGKPGKTEGCGCVFKERAAANIRRIFSDPEVRVRNIAATSARMIRYQAENKAAVIARAHARLKDTFLNPDFIARQRDLVRARRTARNLDPDEPLSTRSVLIRNATEPLRRHIMKERDRYTCALCRRHGLPHLAVHHVIPIEADWSRVGDPTNLITLCHQCHFGYAHGGSWRGIVPGIQRVLQRLAATREMMSPTPPSIVGLVHARLEALGPRMGRKKECPVSTVM